MVAFSASSRVRDAISAISRTTSSIATVAVPNAATASAASFAAMTAWRPITEECAACWAISRPAIDSSSPDAAIAATFWLTRPAMSATLAASSATECASLNMVSERAAESLLWRRQAARALSSSEFHELAQIGPPARRIRDSVRLRFGRQYRQGRCRNRTLLAGTPGEERCELRHAFGIAP